MKCRKILTIIIIFVLVTSGFSIVAQGSENSKNSVNKDKGDVTKNESVGTLFAGGSGTENDPYQISNVEQLQNMNGDLDAYYELVNDIDASETKNWNGGKGFVPIGKTNEKFWGSLDGQGYEVRNLHIDRPNSDDIGLIGCMMGSSVFVDSVGLEDVNINGKNDTGAIVGENYGTVKNSYVTGNVSGGSYVGGVVGQYGTVNNSYAIVNVSGKNWVGGLIGSQGEHDYVKNSYAAGSVSGNKGVGGIVGWSQGKVSNSHYNVDDVLINGKHRITIGGLFDHQYNDWISNGKTLNISDYSDSLVPSGEYYGIDGVQGIKDLLGFADDSDYKFKLTEDIDLSKESGLYVPYLAAEFDGNGYTIKNLHVRKGSQIGFFGYAGDYSYVNDVDVLNANVSGKSAVGGLIGMKGEYCIVNNSYVTGNLSGNRFVGGLIGFSIGDSELDVKNVLNSFTECHVMGDSYVGGLIGVNRGDIIWHSHAKCNVSGDSKIGGLIGLNGGADAGVLNSYANGTVKGGSEVGGLVGDNSVGVVNSYASGKVSGDSKVGGLVGLNDYIVINSYASGKVNGDSKVGGLIGLNEEYSTLNNSYAIGTVKGGSEVGGLVGFNNGDTIDNSFWDMNTTGQSSSDGGTGKTTAEMKEKSTFTDTSTEGLSDAWDFVSDPNDDDSNEDIWDMDGKTNNGYPFLTLSQGNESDTTPPTADAGDDKTVEVGEEFTLDASGSSDNVGIASYEWDLDNGETKTGEQITYTYDEAGTYTVELTVIDEAGNTDMDTMTIQVEESEDTTPPTADAGDDKTVEVGEEFTLDASGSSDNVGIASYEWDLGNGDTKTGEQITYTYDEAGNYTVELTVTDEAGNTDTDTVEITVEESDDGDDDGGSSSDGGGTPGFTLMILLFTITLIAIYRYKVRK